MLYPSTTKTVGVLAIGAAAMLATTPTIADNSRAGLVEITITNITRGQIISPVLVVSHNARLAPLFTLGEKAIPELAALAEDAELGGLADLLDEDPAVFDVAKLVTDAGPIPPGMSATVVIRAPGRYRHVTLAGMLVSTNDAFTALRGVRVPTHGETTVRTLAYDAGSEANSEDCAFIPGPPCGNHVHDTKRDPEGFVHVHAGIHGIGDPDLHPAQYDWRNPVAEVTMRRLRHRD